MIPSEDQSSALNENYLFPYVTALLASTGAIQSAVTALFAPTGTGGAALRRRRMVGVGAALTPPNTSTVYNITTKSELTNTKSELGSFQLGCGQNDQNQNDPNCVNLFTSLQKLGQAGSITIEKSDNQGNFRPDPDRTFVHGVPGDKDKSTLVLGRYVHESIAGDMQLKALNQGFKRKEPGSDDDQESDDNAPPTRDDDNDNGPSPNSNVFFSPYLIAFQGIAAMTSLINPFLIKCYGETGGEAEEKEEDSAVSSPLASKKLQRISSVSKLLPPCMLTAMLCLQLTALHYSTDPQYALAALIIISAAGRLARSTADIINTIPSAKIRTVYQDRIKPLVESFRTDSEEMQQIRDAEIDALLCIALIYISCTHEHLSNPALAVLFLTPPLVAVSNGIVTPFLKWRRMDNKNQTPSTQCDRIWGGIEASAAIGTGFILNSQHKNHINDNDMLIATAFLGAFALFAAKFEPKPKHQNLNDKCMKAVIFPLKPALTLLLAIFAGTDSLAPGEGTDGYEKGRGDQFVTIQDLYTLLAVMACAPAATAILRHAGKACLTCYSNSSKSNEEGLAVPLGGGVINPTLLTEKRKSGITSPTSGGAGSLKIT